MYTLIENEIRNYIVGFLGANRDVKDVPLRKWSQWESYRRENNIRKDIGTPYYRCNHSK